MEFANILEQAWQTAVTGHGNIPSARAIVERWYKGGYLNQRARRFIRRECLWTAVHYRNTEVVLTRQFRLLAVLLYLEGYFLESDTACMHPEKCFILLNAPEMAPGLINGAAPGFWRLFVAISITTDASPHSDVTGIP
ncbi:hypothetical protein [Enterobacter bugandensis]|uniref:hypothetical protein n=1 Tax=Enterobacter bugandensis TaxID=881260 RepID=UPI002FCFA66D